ncbi:MAG TPA: MnhB domain-containing protein [Thermotogota bacterium]|nr:MnhB domain-containing protein [Thermotogota bacterium]
MKLNQIIVLFILVFFGITIIINIGSTQFPVNEVSYLDDVLESNGSLNVVTAIYLDYRLYDSLFEVIVFFIAAFGVSMVLNKLPKSTLESQEEIDYEYDAVDMRMSISGNIIFFLSLLFSIYIMITGHLGPGGGFVGGVIAGTGLLVISGNRDVEEIETELKKMRIHLIEKIVMFFIPASGFLGLIFYHQGLKNFLPAGVPGTLFSGGNALLFNLLIGFKVFVGTWTILYNFVRHRGSI